MSRSTTRFSQHFLNFITELEIDEAVGGHSGVSSALSGRYGLDGLDEDYGLEDVNALGGDEGECLHICREEVGDVFPMLLESSKKINQVGTWRSQGSSSWRARELGYLRNSFGIRCQKSTPLR